jgi:hypothetical protein
MILDDVVGCHIITTQNMSKEECDDLIKRLEVTRLAGEALATAKITFQDYLDCLEMAQVNINNFLITANDNAQAIGF